MKHLLLSFLALTACLRGSSATAAEGTRPNILFAIADDWGLHAVSTMKRLFAGLLLNAALASIVLSADVRRPNILFILVDDQSPFDLKAYNPKSPLQTPTLDRLAAQGMVLDGAYHLGAFIGAVCTPSRHMIMSGRVGAPGRAHHSQ